MTYANIEYSVTDGVAVVTLNRPDTLNSFTSEMHAEMRAALEAARIDAAVRCLVIAANGRGFCAGQDLAEVAGSTDADLGIAVETRWNPLIRAIMTLPKPVICAVNGVAAGAGASIALACDIVIAARSASFVQAFARIGLIPDSGGTWNLPRAVGLPRAKGLALLGDKLTAERAETWGMIWQCVDDATLLDEVMKLARHVATQPTAGLAQIKRLLQESSANPLHQQLQLELDTMRVLGRSHDYREGVAAFLAKRKPQFTGE